MPPAPDVVVIGAGAAGLAAARAISEAGRRVVVLEGRGRMGGRILTVHDPEWAVAAELGPEFLHGEAEDARRIVDGAGLGVLEIPDRHVRAERGRITRMDDSWERLLRVRRRFARLRRDVSVAEALVRLSIPAADRKLARLFVEGYYAAPLDRASARWLAAGDDEDTEFRQYRLAEGYDGLVRWLADGLDPRRVDVRLSTAAEMVRWTRGTVEVGVRRAFGGGYRGRVRARACVVTVPMGVLQAAPGEPAAIRFEPDPPALARARRAVISSNVCKLLLRFREPLWEKVVPRGADFLHDESGPFPTWWTANPMRAPVLTAWAAGPRADELAGLDEGALVARAIDALASTLGRPRRTVASQLLAWKSHDWRRDPWSRGAYAAVAVGGTPAQAALARPVEGTLFFAGEATEAKETGTVSGALSSGARAARQVLAAL
jgi:monoamine oxidase